MSFDHLIDSLARDVPRVHRSVRFRRLLLGICAGALLALGIVAIALGLRADLGSAMHRPAFWIKWAYTLSLGLGTVAMTARLARPEPVRIARFWPILIPPMLLAAAGIAQLCQAPVREWRPMWLGATWMVCPWLILGLSAPIFAGLLWAFRNLAPTRLRAAGAAAGLAAGSWAATLYSLHCPETSALFVVTWYTLGIVLAASAGALIGPRALRW